jgi:hypothetical protein
MIIVMAKYTSTSMDFFLKLQWLEGMFYWDDVGQLAAEEKEAIQPTPGPPTLPSYR